ncbi:MAG: hypothetical protein JOZ80_13130 [Acidobacteriaceae bacterium]|nr:hypothetical protein [Acidobacteriaceae bacterium]
MYSTRSRAVDIASCAHATVRSRAVLTGGSSLAGTMIGLAGGELPRVDTGDPEIGSGIGFIATEILTTLQRVP